MASLIINSYLDGYNNKNIIAGQLQSYSKAGITTIGAAGLFNVLSSSNDILAGLGQDKSCPVRMVIMTRGEEMEVGLLVESGSGAENRRSLQQDLMMIIESAAKEDRIEKAEYATMIRERLQAYDKEYTDSAKLFRADRSR